MKTILFLAVFALYCLSSCEKNYSCVCQNTLTDQFGNPYVPTAEYTYKIKDIKATKYKAKKECDEEDMVGLDTFSLGSYSYVIRDCSITKFK